MMEVESYAGYDYPERPRALIWQGERFEISEVLSQARRPSGPWFRVRTEDDQVFDLFYNLIEKSWQVQAV